MPGRILNQREFTFLPVLLSRPRGQQFRHKKSGFFRAIQVAKSTLTVQAGPLPASYVKVTCCASSTLDNCSKGNEGIIVYR